MRDKDTSANISWQTIAITFAIVAVVWIVMGFASHALAEQPGTFGDSFGFANSLFSALAFAGVIVALFMQMQELRLQREELRQTREELERTANAQEGTEKHLAASAQIAALGQLLLHYTELSSKESTRQNIRPATVARDNIRSQLERHAHGFPVATAGNRYAATYIEIRRVNDAAWMTLSTLSPISEELRLAIKDAADGIAEILHLRPTDGNASAIEQSVSDLRTVVGQIEGAYEIAGLEKRSVTWDDLEPYQAAGKSLLEFIEEEVGRILSDAGKPSAALPARDTDEAK